MPMTAGMYTSNCPDWETPWELFAPLNDEFVFTLDVCATDETFKCLRYFTPQDDGLAQEWDGVCWMNPPYGREIGKWMHKAYEESLKGATVVCLVPARTDTAWWHNYCTRADEIRFLRGRVKFLVGGQGQQSAPFPSAIVIFRAALAERGQV